MITVSVALNNTQIDGVLRTFMREEKDEVFFGQTPNGINRPEYLELLTLNYFAEKLSLTTVYDYSEKLTDDQYKNIKVQLKDEYTNGYTSDYQGEPFLLAHPFGKTNHPDGIIVWNGSFYAFECKYSNKAKPKLGETAPRGLVRYVYANAKPPNTKNPGVYNITCTLGRDIGHPLKDEQYQRLKTYEEQQKYLLATFYYFGSVRIRYNPENRKPKNHITNEVILPDETPFGDHVSTNPRIPTDVAA